jgi:hypothetical protein
MAAQSPTTAYAFSRNLQDSQVSPAAFALPNSASTTVSSATVDLGDNYPYETERLEIGISIPALSTTIVPDTRTVTLSAQAAQDSGFSTGLITLFSQVFTGAGGNGIAAQVVRDRIPSNCPRYIRFQVAFGASTTDGSANKATPAIFF